MNSRRRPRSCQEITQGLLIVGREVRGMSTGCRYTCRLLEFALWLTNNFLLFVSRQTPKTPAPLFRPKDFPWMISDGWDRGGGSHASAVVSRALAGVLPGCLSIGRGFEPRSSSDAEPFLAGAAAFLDAGPGTAESSASSSTLTTSTVVAALPGFGAMLRGVGLHSTASASLELRSLPERLPGLWLLAESLASLALPATGFAPMSPTLARDRGGTTKSPSSSPSAGTTLANSTVVAASPGIDTLLRGGGLHSTASASLELRSLPE